jgi:hypothetical protein
MAAFLYFIPDAIVNSVESLPEATGLRAILGDAGSFSAFPVAQFVLPNRLTASGTLVATPNDPGDLVAIRQDEQEWTPVVKDNVTTHWIGVWKAAPPTPEDLRHAELVDGNSLKLGEHEWVVPVIHPPLQTTLPRIFRMTGTGPTMEPEPKYRELQTESVGFFEWVANMGAKPETEEQRAEAMKRTPTWGETFGYCARVLGVNYRIGMWELGALGMLNTNNARDVVFYSLGLKQWLDEVNARPKA